MIMIATAESELARIFRRLIGRGDSDVAAVLS